MKKIWFSGLPISLPLGILMAVCYSRLVLRIRGLAKYGLQGDTYGYISLESSDWLIMLAIVAIIVVLVFFANVKRKVLDGETDFGLGKRLDPARDSADKMRVKHHAPPLKYLTKKPSGLTVGRYMNRFVSIPFLNSPEHQLILGSPGSNKSTTLLNALLYNYNFADESDGLCSVIAIDAKPELSAKSVSEARPDIRIINPTTYDSYGFNVFYGLDQNSSDDELKERTEIIAHALIPSLSGDNEHFSGNAQKILSGFLMYGFRKGYSFTKSIIEVMNASVGNLIAEIIEDPAMQNHPKILHKIKSFDGNDSDEFASIKDTLEKDLDIFDVDTVQHCFSNNSRMVTPADLANGISVYLAIPDHLLTQYKTVFGLIMELSLKYLMSLPEEDIRDRRPIWCLVDEGGTIYVPSLLDVAARGRSKGVQLSIVTQSFSQLESLYGDRQARSIMDCCKTTVVFSCNDSRTARDLSLWTGMYRETKTSQHHTGMIPEVFPARNISEEFRPVMDIADIKNLEKDSEVLVFTKGDWFLVEKAPYFTIPEFKYLSDEIYARNVRQPEPPAVYSGVKALYETINTDNDNNYYRR